MWSVWDYEKSEYIMKKVLHRPCVSHETIFNKTNELGEAVSIQLEGTKIKELEDNKKLQEDYFDSMKVNEQPAPLIYIDMDGVMINSRDKDSGSRGYPLRAKRMEGKVAVIWTKRELVNAYTYALTDKRYMGSFSDPERFYWDVTAELYKRSGGKMDDIPSLVRGDGAPFIRGFRENYTPRSRYLLDHHHLCEKLKERLGTLYEDKEKRAESITRMLEHLNSDDVDGALFYIHELTGKFRNKRKLYHLKKLSAYIERNRDDIWYKEARKKGISIGSDSVDKAVDILICRRMKLRGMRWSRDKADNVLNIRILVLNGEWDEFWKKHKAA